MRDFSYNEAKEGIALFYMYKHLLRESNFTKKSFYLMHSLIEFS